MIEQERESAEPTPLLDVLRKAYRGSRSGRCSAAELLLIGLLRTSPLRSSRNFTPVGSKEFSRLALPPGHTRSPLREPCSFLLLASLPTLPPPVENELRLDMVRPERGRQESK
jgi:hypothetical protein